MHRLAKIFLAFIFFLALLFFARGFFYPIFLDLIYKETVEQVKTKNVVLDQHLLLDCREKEEYQISQIKNAIYLGYEDFEPSRLNEFPKDTSILLYCSIGYRSERIGEQLIDLGYTNVQHLRGGIFAWKNQGKTVFKSEKVTEAVHPFSPIWGFWLRKGKKTYPSK